MPSKPINEDLRITKTRKALFAAMFSLLNSLSFKKITVKEICAEALVSRATFYAHFVDKYDLLRHWMIALWPSNINRNDPYEQMEEKINGYVHENMLLLRNLIYDADEETCGILFDFILTTVNPPMEKEGGEMNPKDIVFSNFFAGGIISYLSWQVKNRFPPDVPVMNKYFYETIHDLQDC